MRSLPFAALALLAPLSACTPPEPEPGGMVFGEAVRRNIIAQAVYPDGPPPLAAEPGMDGDRALLMIDRYKLDKAEKPAAIGTSSVGGGAGGGSGGGS